MVENRRRRRDWRSEALVGLTYLGPFSIFGTPVVFIRRQSLRNLLLKLISVL